MDTLPASAVPVTVKNNHPLQADYSSPVNNPQVLQNMRAEGKTYASHIAGTVTGVAYKKDWGITGTANFKYVYGFNSTGKILKNDGMTIEEERTFTDVVEQVMVSKVEIGFDLPAVQLGLAISGLSWLVQCPVDPATVTAPIQALNEVKVSLDESQLNALAKYFPNSMDFDKVKKDLQLFTHRDGGLMLNGKTVKITFEDGEGVTRIDPVDCALTQDEINAIIRSNFIMDHYLMPDRKVAVGDKWKVNANVFSGLLDSRIKGRVEGSVAVQRAADVPMPNGDVNYKLKLTDGNVTFKKTDNGNAITGRINSVNGTAIMPESSGVVTEATLKGHAEYSELSTDHLLFEASMTIQPSFEVKYECEVQDEAQR